MFDAVRIAPGITVGLSVITKAVGIEAVRELEAPGNAKLLGYLGPARFPPLSLSTGSSTAPACLGHSGIYGKARTQMYSARVFDFDSCHFGRPQRSRESRKQWSSHLRA